MTDKPAAIQATYSDLKFVKTRGVVQIVMEAPIENAPAVIGLLGTPHAAQEVMCAIAVLDTKAAQQASTAQERPKQHYRDMKPSQRAYNLCNNPRFLQWIASIDTESPMPVDVVEAAAWLRRKCGVESRSEFDEPEPYGSSGPRACFEAKEEAFHTWERYGASPDPQARADAPSPSDVAKPPVKPESQGADSSPSKDIFDTLKLAADHSRTHAQLDGAWRDNKAGRAKLTPQEHEKLLLHFSQRRQEIEREQG